MNPVRRFARRALDGVLSQAGYRLETELDPLASPAAARSRSLSLRPARDTPPVMAEAPGAVSIDRSVVEEIVEFFRYVPPFYSEAAPPEFRIAGA